MNFLPAEFLKQAPPVTYNYAIIIILISVATTLNILSPFNLIFDFDLIFNNFQFHRLVTGFLYTGSINLQWLINTFSNIQTLARAENHFPRNSLKLLFTYLLLSITLFSKFIPMPLPSIPFLSAISTIFVIYFPDNLVQIFGIFEMKAKYLPAIQLALSNDYRVQILGMAIGAGWVLIERTLLK
ncbi:Derlin [Spironucleus salmonicida]|uniref:Derlin n=1 Tax=Spironucleus salmonicida TaxID=348837 RepID=V6LRW8_9EUKA|nr:Derlin [Spironucleus salmonicida]|eukprot:EST47320.1 Der1-like family protein [Spironucleus salmonicida]